MTVSFKPVFINCEIKLEGTEFSSSISFVFNNFCHSTIREFIMHSRLLFFGRFYHGIPDAAFFINSIKKHEFSFSAGSFLYSVNAGTSHTAVVKNHEGTRLYKVWQVVHHVMFYLACSTIQKHKLILSAHSTWVLGNKFFGQVKIKI